MVRKYEIKSDYFDDEEKIRAMEKILDMMDNGKVFHLSKKQIAEMRETVAKYHENEVHNKNAFIQTPLEEKALTVGIGQDYESDFYADMMQLPHALALVALHMGAIRTQNDKRNLKSCEYQIDYPTNEMLALYASYTLWRIFAITGGEIFGDDNPWLWRTYDTLKKATLFQVDSELARHGFEYKQHYVENFVNYLIENTPIGVSSDLTFYQVYLSLLETYKAKSLVMTKSENPKMEAINMVAVWGFNGEIFDDESAKANREVGRAIQLSLSGMTEYELDVAKSFYEQYGHKWTPTANWH